MPQTIARSSSDDITVSFSCKITSGSAQTRIASLYTLYTRVHRSFTITFLQYSTAPLLLPLTLTSFRGS
ncbi:hypothetical protein XELAEV_18040516mg [Xenopus laevis]|uniref:Uncharacterized protein n=1 Tax=Xenopus laevis TaxID=8355 RepID=A0A974C9T1_XENLA|nr:hypothetical protein XELAEV_18040516mg [Xenopus laevis]